MTQLISSHGTFLAMKIYDSTIGIYYNIDYDIIGNFLVDNIVAEIKANGEVEEEEELYINAIERAELQDFYQSLQNFNYA